MWHPFFQVPDGKEVSPELRMAAIPARARLTYGERVIRWYRLVRGTSERTPILNPGLEETRAGIVIETGEPTAGQREVKLRLERIHDSPHSVEATLHCDTAGLRSPREWQVRQSFIREAASSLLPDIRERGSFAEGTVKRTISAGQRTMESSLKAQSLIAPYTWLAGFPLDLTPADWSDSTVVMEEMSVFSRGAAIGRVTPSVVAHPIAAGLLGVVLRHGGGMPLEFWVNEKGLVVYLCASPTRMFVLERIEALS
jgi:hypothetical protein